MTPIYRLVKLYVVRVLIRCVDHTLDRGTSADKLSEHDTTVVAWRRVDNTTDAVEGPWRPYSLYT